MNSAHTREDKRWTAKRVATRCTSASTPWLTRTSQFRIPWASGAPPVSHFSLHSSASLKPLLSPALTHPLLRSLQNPHNPSSPVTGGCSQLQRKQLYLQLPLITFASGMALAFVNQSLWLLLLVSLTISWIMDLILGFHVVCMLV